MYAKVHTSFPLPPPMITSYTAVLQYQKRDIGLGTTQRAYVFFIFSLFLLTNTFLFYLKNLYCIFSITI